MNVEKITLERSEARDRLRAYESTMRGASGANYLEYQAVAHGLRALAAGETLLDLERAIRTAPADEKGRPRLAVARADRRQVQMITAGSTLRFSTKFGWGRGSMGTFSPSFQVEFDMRRNVNPLPTSYALVPLVPPEGIKKAHGFSGLRFYFTLFEVEAWADQPLNAEPDRDPYLLRHVHGQLYAIVHEWDLTPLERAVMDQRRLQ